MLSYGTINLLMFVEVLMLSHGNINHGGWLVKTMQPLSSC